MRIFKASLKYLFGILFILAGANHFYNPNFYLKIMPPFLPAPLFLVYLSGIFEIALGILLLIPGFTCVAAWGLIALLIAVFPANIYMWMNPQLFPEFSQTALFVRLLAQFILIAWAFWFTKSEKTA